MIKRVLPLLMLIVLIAAGCSNDNPTKPHNVRPAALAGGGRLQNNDPFRGGAEDSGPNNPGIGDFRPDSGLIPLFYSDTDCGKQPTQQVIRDSAAWAAWWETAVSCLWRGDTTMPGHGPRGSHRGGGMPGGHMDSVGMDSMWVDSTWPDTGWVDTSDVDTVYPCERCVPELPWVDFEKNVVIVISIEADSGFGRSVWVKEVTNDPAGATVRYQVTKLGEECLNILMMPIIAGPTSPTIAVQAPKPVNEPITWVRTDTTYTCTWEPDPKVPLTLYYTDAVCDLGSGETVIRDSARFEAWMKTASACDMARWYKPDDPTLPPGDTSGGRGFPGDSIIIPPVWGGFDVNFSTHAVIILRAGEQHRWGGGIWLYEIKAKESGTTIDYTVLEPTENCPPIEGDQTTLNPTVAIRVPLPLPEPIVFNRKTETIDCDWGKDSTWVVVDSVGRR